MNNEAEQIGLLEKIAMEQRLLAREMEKLDNEIKKLTENLIFKKERLSQLYSEWLQHGVNIAKVLQP